MTIKRRDFQKAAALIREFLLKLTIESECAELRDSLNLALLHMQRYYHSLRAKFHSQDRANSGAMLAASLRGLSPMTPFRDAPDKFQWKWVTLDSPKLTAGTLPVDPRQSYNSLPLIVQAAKEGDNDLIMQLIDRDAMCLHEVDQIGRTALIYAVQFNHLDTVQVLLEQGSQINTTAQDGSTAVHRACHNSNHEALQLLIDYNAELSMQDVHGRAPIHWACTTQDTECLQLLIKQNVSVTLRDCEGMTPSMWACRLDNIEHFGLISGVENQTTEEEDGFERDSYGRTWLHWSVRRTEPLECLKTLLTEESSQMRDDDGKTVMLAAAEQGSLSAVKLITEIIGKHCLEDKDSQNRTPLILATMGGHGETVNYMLSEGVDIAAVDSTGATAWDYARGRQLHYCMLIIASYIRQQSREEMLQNGHMGHHPDDEAEDEIPSYSEHYLDGRPDHMMNGDTSLQVTDQQLFYNSKPTIPPHPPAQPPTPRTPRGPLTPRGPISAPPAHSQGDSFPFPPESPTPRIPHTPRAPPTPRGQKVPQRSVSAPVLVPNNASPERPESRDVSSAGSGGSKRKKSDIESSDEDTRVQADRQSLPADQSMMGYEQNPYAVSTNPNQGNSQLQDYNNQGQFADDEDDHLSIGAMDVSDLEGEENEEAEPMQHSPPTQQRSPPQPHPRRPPQHQTHTPAQPMEYEHPQTSPPQYVDYSPSQDDTDGYQSSQVPPPAPRGGGATTHRQPPVQDQSPSNSVPSSADSRRHMPPSHLSPLPPRSPGHKVKKKKKKRRENYDHPQDIPPPRGYVTPIPPPYHANYPPQQGHMTNRERSPPRSTYQNQPTGVPPRGQQAHHHGGEGQQDPAGNGYQGQGHHTQGPNLQPPTLQPPSKKRHSMSPHHATLEHEQKFALNEQMKATKPVPSTAGTHLPNPRAPPLPQAQLARTRNVQQNEQNNQHDVHSNGEDDDWDDRPGSGQRWMKGQGHHQGQLSTPRGNKPRFTKSYSENPQHNNGPVPAPRDQRVFPSQQTTPAPGQLPPQGGGLHHRKGNTSPGGHQGQQQPSPRSANKRGDKTKGVPSINKPVPNGRLPPY